MRILSYNILDGGEGRADPLAEVIEAHDPDILTLIEADYLPVIERIAARLKMDYIVGNGPNHDVAILSRWTIRRSINHAPLHPNSTANFLEAAIATPGDGDLVVGAVHLHSHALDEDERRREAQLDVILSATQAYRDARQPHVLMGDFNANAPQQRIDISKAKPSTREAYERNGNVIPRRVIARMLENGYVDTLRAVHGEAADGIASFTTQFPQQRVDYIFSHGIDKARIARGWVEQDRLATYASDHYPVGVEIV